MGPETIIGGSGVAALIMAVAYGGKLLLDAWRERHKAKTEDRKAKTESHTLTVTDAATANALLLNSMRGLSEDNERLRQWLEEADAKIARYQSELAVLREQVGQLQAQLHVVQERLTALSPDEL